MFNVIERIPYDETHDKGKDRMCLLFIKDTHKAATKVASLGLCELTYVHVMEAAKFSTWDEIEEARSPFTVTIGCALNVPETVTDVLAFSESAVQEAMKICPVLSEAEYCCFCMGNNNGVGWDIITIIRHALVERSPIQ